MRPMTDTDKTSFKSWAIILTLAFLFIAWGLFIFFTVGDKGPPAWNFGVVQDIPGESSYSTHPPRQGRGTAPESQHVSRKPSRALTEVQKDKP